MTVPKDNKRITNAWAFYDWANSVFPLVMTAAIFPAFYTGITEHQFNGPLVDFFGIHVKNSVIYEYALSFSFLIVAFLSPILSGIADFTGNKKSFMRSFVYLGSLATALMVTFNGHNIELGLLLFVIANIGFNGSLVFYNAFLPEISSVENMDKLSAKGFARGYLGSTLLLSVCLAIILTSDITGLQDNLAVYIAFILTGLWWFGFSHISFRHLPGKRKSKEKITVDILSKGFKELRSVWTQLSKSKAQKQFLASFFFMSMGVQTVIYVASLFGKSELKLGTEFLIGAILLIQIVAIGGAHLFANLSKRKGNIFALTLGLMIWILACVAAYFVNGKWGFFFLAALVGLVMGGTQSLTRSTYSKLIPGNTKDPSSYFSFYEFSEKIAIVLGTFSYALIEHISGTMRNSVIALIIFFLLGIIILQGIRKDPRISHSKTA